MSSSMGSERKPTTRKWRSALKSHRAITALALGAIIVLGGGAVLASHDANTIHACSHDATGALRQVEDAEECRQNETAVEWNIEGPQGPQGEPGQDGQDGVSGLEVVATEIRVPGTATGRVEAVCPEGKVATGGGHEASADGGNGSNTIIQESGPGNLSQAEDGTWSGDRWVVRFDNTGTTHPSGQGNAKAYVVCAAVPE
jgi:hypothetical protein